MPGLKRILVLAGLLLIGGGAGATALGQDIDLGGRAYVDYFYNFSAPDAEEEHLHGFRYRRLYLTTDFTLSEAFEGRARLEANDGTTGPNGPEPFVKDLFLRWAYSGEHRATLGVTSPPAFGVSNDVWGYRSLDKTILDRRGIVGSRDFGLRLDGPLGRTGAVRYSVMLANNNAVSPETDPYKRVYGQLHAAPSDRLTLVLGGDYAGYGDERERAGRLSAFAGYSTERVRLGLEGYWYRLTFAEGSDRTDIGGSLFGIVQVAPEWDLLVRLDRGRDETGEDDLYETFLLGGVAYRPHPNVALIPNFRMRDPSNAAAATTGRITVEMTF